LTTDTADASVSIAWLSAEKVRHNTIPEEQYKSKKGIYYIIVNWTWTRITQRPWTWTLYKDVMSVLFDLGALTVEH